MEGEGRRRQCAVCGKSVHALDEYSDEEISRLRRETGNALCGYSGAVGAPASPVRRVLLAGALVSVIRPSFGQTSGVRLTVVDATGAGIPSALVTTADKSGKNSSKSSTDRFGEIFISGLAEGVHSVRVESPGFKTGTGLLRVQPGSLSVSKIQLEIGLVGQVAFVEPTKR